MEFLLSLITLTDHHEPTSFTKYHTEASTDNGPLIRYAVTYYCLPNVSRLAARSRTPACLGGAVATIPVVAARSVVSAAAGGGVGVGRAVGAVGGGVVGRAGAVSVVAGGCGWSVVLAGVGGCCSHDGMRDTNSDGDHDDAAENSSRTQPDTDVGNSLLLGSPSIQGLYGQY